MKVVFYILLFIYGKFNKGSTDIENNNILSTIFYFWNDCKQDYMAIIDILLGISSKFLALIGITGGFLYFISALSQSTPSNTLLFILLGVVIIETGRETYYDIIEREDSINRFR